ncbi:MAG: hypothetical protein LBD89_03890 [Tannerellaceae bacterium]|jgi:ATP-dependent DNA helicase RecG|nr:hypothetical protein [Tannerellaceae bacterium]
MITKQQLQHILTDTESYLIERTTSTDNADKFCQAIWCLEYMITEYYRD